MQITILSIDQYITPSARGCKSDFNWLESINYDSNAVIAVKQMYSFSYNTICFKYAYKKNRQCWFDFFLLCRLARSNEIEEK